MKLIIAQLTEEKLTEFCDYHGVLENSYLHKYYIRCTFIHRIKRILGNSVIDGNSYIKSIFMDHNQDLLDIRIIHIQTIILSIKIKGV